MANGTNSGAQAGSIFLRLQVQNQGQFQSSVNSIANQAGASGGSLLGSSMGSMFKKVFNAAMIAAIPAAIIAGIRKAMKSSMVELASDLNEVQNVVNKAFGSMKQSAEDFASGAMESFGITELQAKQYSSTYMSMARAMGISEEAAAKMSINLTKLSADVASFYNLTNDESYEKFKGVFSGETEPLKALGIVIPQTNLEAYALKEGIQKSYKEMSEAEKVALRYKFIMDQLALAQGDFASTADGWANSMKTLENRWDAFKTKVGNGMIKVFTPLLQLLDACVAKLSELMDTLYKRLGWDFGEDEAVASTNTITTSAEDSAVAISDAYEDAVKKSKKAIEGLAGFDQINKLTNSNNEDDENSSASSYADGGGEFSFNPFGNEYTTQTEKSGNKMKIVVDKVVDKIRDIWDKYGKKVVDIIKNIYEFFKPYGERLIALVKKLKEVFSEWWAENGEEFKQSVSIIWGYVVEIVSYLLDKLFAWLEKWGPRFLTAVLDFFKDAAAFLEKYGPYINDVLKAIIDAFAIILDVISFIVAAIVSEFFPVLDAIITAVSLVVYTVSNIVMGLIFTIADCIGWLFKTIVEVGIWIWNAVDSLITGILDILLMLWDAIDTGITGALDFIVQFFTDIWNALSGFVTNAFEVISNAFTSVKDFFSDLWTNIKGFFSDAGQAVKDFWNGFLEAAKAPINGIISLINMMIDGLNTIQFDIPDWLGGGTFGINISHIPMLASGGVVSAPTLAMVGEGSQPEAVVPLDDFKRDIAEIVATSVASVIAEFSAAKSEGTEDNSGNIELTVNVGGEKLYNNVIKEINRRSRNNGKCVINT